MDELMEGFVNGAKQFWQWVSNPFEVCCCPGRRAHDEDDNGKRGVEEGYIDLWHKENNGGVTCITTPAEGRVVAHGGIKNKDKKTGRLTAEALRSLNPSGISACGGRRPAASHSSGQTLDNSSQHSSTHNAFGIQSTRGGASKRPSHGVRFSSGVDVIAKWDLHLARVARVHRDGDAEDGRGTATITPGGGDIVSVAEDHVTGPRRSFIMSTRAARFAMEDGGGGGGGNDTIGRRGKGVGPYGGDQSLMYGMKDIIAPSRWGTKGIKGSGAGLWGEEEKDEEEEAIPTLLDSYDGSLASLKSLVFPLNITDRPVKRLFDASVLASTSPAKSMTATELDAILGRLRGWKNAGDAGGSRKRSRRATRTTKNAGYGSGGDKSDCGATSQEEAKLRRVSSDNSALRAELFALAKGERRESLLFKRAFLNAEGGSVSSRQ